MNSLVNITSHGAKVIFEDSKFTNINICGSLIKNVQGLHQNPDLSQISEKYLSAAERAYIAVFESLQYTLAQEYSERYETGAKDSINFASEILISGSTFDNLNFNSDVIKDLP
jgi:hypothetical protein